MGWRADFHHGFRTGVLTPPRRCGYPLAAGGRGITHFMGPHHHVGSPRFDFTIPRYLRSGENAAHFSLLRMGQNTIRAVHGQPQGGLADYGSRAWDERKTSECPANFREDFRSNVFEPPVGWLARRIFFGRTIRGLPSESGAALNASDPHSPSVCKKDAGSGGRKYSTARGLRRF